MDAFGLGELRGLFRRKSLYQFADGAAGGGNGHVGSDFGEGSQDEAAKVQTRMGNGQPGLVDDLVGVEDEIKIEGAGQPGLDHRRI